MPCDLCHFHISYLLIKIFPIKLKFRPTLSVVTSYLIESTTMMQIRMLAVLITTESLYNPCSRLTGSISPSISPSPQYCLSRRIEIQSSVSVKLSVPSIPYIPLQPKYDALSMSWSVHLFINDFFNFWFLSPSSSFNCIISYVQIPARPREGEARGEAALLLYL